MIHEMSQVLRLRVHIRSRFTLNNIEPLDHLPHWINIIPQWLGFLKPEYSLKSLRGKYKKIAKKGYTGSQLWKIADKFQTFPKVCTDDKTER